MKILWITNVLLPEAYRFLTPKSRNGSGGWLEASSKELMRAEDVSLSIASASPLVQTMVTFQSSGINYYVFPFKNYDSAHPYEYHMKQLRDDIKPNVVHIHGTECPYGLAYLDVVGPGNAVVSMQGVIGSIADHYTDGLSKWQIYTNITPRDLRLKTIIGEKREYQKRGLIEEEIIKKAKYIIGRTSFDKNYVLSVNPTCEYLFMNESLRESFYHNKWDYEVCEPHTIFLSQSNYPVKGLHQVLRALPLIREKYPDVKVRIAGEDITKHRTKADLIKYSGYGSIVYRLMNKLGVKNCVSFTGLLSETEMVQEYLKANVFVCPSTCENSSNSIAEAQILGVPCIASSRGGNPDMIPNSNCGFLFDFYDIKGLADLVIYVFDSAAYFDNSEVRDMASKRHDRKTNLMRTLSIYNLIRKSHEI